MENATKLKSFLKENNIHVNLQIKDNDHYAIMETPEDLHQQTFEIIKTLDLKKGTITRYASSSDRSIIDLSIIMYLNDSNPKEEFQIDTSNFPKSNRISYNISFSDKENKLEDFLRNNPFINQQYETLESIFKKSLGVSKQTKLNEVKHQREKHGFRIRTYSEDCINAADHIAISGGKGHGFTFGVRYALTENPNNIFEAITQYRNVLKEFKDLE